MLSVRFLVIRHHHDITATAKDYLCVSPGGGGALGYFLGGYVPPGTPNWHPVLKKNSPKIDTPFKKWANFLYPVLEFALKLIPRSRNGPIFLYSVQGCNKSTKVCLLMHWTIFLKAICPWIISNGCLQNWSFRAFEILYPVLENASEMDIPF